MKSWMKGRNVRLVIGLAMAVALVWAGSVALAAEIPQVKPEELKKMIETKQSGFVVVDTQPKGVYNTGHIKGAVSFPWAPEIKSAGNLPKNKTLILYCDCAHEEDSLDTAEQLMSKFGYTDVKVLQGGWSKWQELGYPVEKK